MVCGNETTQFDQSLSADADAANVVDDDADSAKLKNWKNRCIASSKMTWSDYDLDIYWLFN